MTKHIAIAMAYLMGFGLIFIGGRFLIAPELAEAGYGLRFDEQYDYSFHYMKGIRDLLSGLLICILAWSKQTKALSISLLISPIVPFVDTIIVLEKKYTVVTQAIPHVFAIIISIAVALALLLQNKSSTESIQNHESLRGKN
ncbi:DUF4267 domain-containing protein [Sphingobacterium griseoflavum]|uniref:DUF4267 domain-containing protein n=1 Tax=Sphingobacterium griseoflavum TaxID=1474952 RepID=A0ABQ3HUQ4_9SPHI|nr:DUF4267 domain-containing protein [Sphingobacterium griseoflavum]GHE35487.1 hypothetical protein GCM10017764_18470 [Sphingobacterium griseoflavum]